MLSIPQKGVSLIITFFIMLIIAAVVLAVSALLYGEIKIIRNIGSSVVAFYSADSGIEKALYYDRKVIPTSDDAKRGACAMCASPNPSCPTDDPESSFNCSCQPNYTESSNGCNPAICNDCKISFDTSFNNKTYKVKITVPPRGRINDLLVDSIGSYNDVDRAINVILLQESAPSAPGPPGGGYGPGGGGHGSGSVIIIWR